MLLDDELIELVELEEDMALLELDEDIEDLFMLCTAGFRRFWIQRERARARSPTQVLRAPLLLMALSSFSVFAAGVLFITWPTCFMQDALSRLVLPIQDWRIAFTLLLRLLAVSGFACMRLSLFIHSTLSIPVLSIHGLRDEAEELLIAEDEETEDEDIVDDTDDDSAEEELEELSAKLSGTRTIAVDAATNRERDFFIRKKGKETDAAYHRGSTVELV